jgi:hypothetical protein
MQTAVACAIGIDPDRVSVKGKTNEGVDAVGRGEAIAAHAIALSIFFTITKSAIVSGSKPRRARFKGQ